MTPSKGCFCEGYWNAVVEELLEQKVDEKVAQRAVTGYREFMKPAGWTIYNDSVTESARMAKGWLQKWGGKGTVYVLAASDTISFSEKTASTVPNSISAQLPTVNEIEKLPRWAFVAYSSRCARRVAPLYVWFDRTSAPANLQAIESAVTHAENAARFSSSQQTISFVDAALAAALATSDAAADDVAFSAMSAAKSAGGGGATDATQAGNAAAKATIPIGSILNRIRSDYVAISTWSKANAATNATPCPPVVAGPLWPEGPPAGWPELPSAKRCKLNVRIPDGVALNDGLKQINKLAELLGKLDIAGGGHGLALQPPLGISKAKTRVKVRV